MSLRTGSSRSLTLLSATVLLVALVAVVFAFAAEVEGDGCHTDSDVADVHEDLEGHLCGGADTDHEQVPHVAISSTEPGAVVAIQLTVESNQAIPANGTITVDFSGPTTDSGFILPSSITNPASATTINARVIIRDDNADIFPSHIQVEGTQVVLTIPSGVTSGEYTITFKSSAGIRNPYYANPNYEGSRVITVLSEGETPDQKDEIKVVIRRTTTLTPSEGQRTERLTLMGKGYAKGTVTIFDRDPADGGAQILDTATTSNGAFTASNLPIRASLGSDAYTIWTKDSEGVVDKATFRITGHTLSIEPPTAVVGSTLRITIIGWPDMNMGVAAVRIAGTDAHITEAIEYQNCVDYTGRYLGENRVWSFDVVVPEGLLPGTQTVSLYDYDELLINEGTAGMPCEEGQDKGQPTGTELTVRLPDYGIPTIQTTVQVALTEPPLEPRGQKVVEVDGGRDRELKFYVYVPPGDRSGYFDAGDQIEITLPGFDLSRARFDTALERENIRISGSEHDEDVADAVNPEQVDVVGDRLILTIPGSPAVTHGANEDLVITIEEGTGILTPEIPQGFEDPEDGYPVTVTFVDRAPEQPKAKFVDDERNIVVVKNPVSSSVPSTRVRVELVTYAEANIGSSEEILVDFSGPSADSEFTVPANITNTRVTIQPDGRSSFNPSEVLVQGARIALIVPAGTSPKEIPEGEFTIVFSNLAGIRNPSSAGNRVIRVSSSVDGDLPDEITAVISRRITTTIDPVAGPRGTRIRLEGRGYARGTVTIYEGDDNVIDAGETLASVETRNGAFTVSLISGGAPGDLAYTVRTRDSEGKGAELVFLISSAMTFEPVLARVGSPLKITLADWRDRDQEVAAVAIAGQQAYVTPVRQYENCFDYTGVYWADRRDVVSLTVIVPPAVPPGNQTVSLYGHSQLEHIDELGKPIADQPWCEDFSERGARVSSSVTARIRAGASAIANETVQVVQQDLVLSPSTAARGQKVTITGSGFSRARGGDDHIASVSIGGIRVAEDHSQMELGSEGDFAFAVTVPLDIADGSHYVQVEGHDGTVGQATLIIADATLTLDPPQGQRGTDFKVTGRGFIAREVVVLTYGPEHSPYGEDIALADAQGNFELTFTVPLAAKLGSSYQVRAVTDSDAIQTALTVDAEASHLVLGVTITTSPELVSPGERLTIRAQNLPSLTRVGPVSIGGIKVLDRSGVATDENGFFETDVLVPNLDFGDKTLLIQVAEVIVPHIIKVAPPPLSGPPSQVFKYLIRDGVLLTVWHYENATQSWSLFDPSLPTELVELNDLTEVDSGDIVWLNLSKPELFQGKDLAVGWNLISLK